ncbi:odorant receptor 10-like [Lycorma delicatula]|uniref:odorant receptor 10-like n=1 Tax=Lycorma delicatula TaxID=130591 RepID=UPI003F51439F
MKNVPCYILIFLIYAIENMAFWKYSCMAFTVGIISMKVIVTEIKLLCLSIKEMNVILNKTLKDIKTVNGSTVQNNENYADIVLKRYMRFIIQNHQHLYSKIKQVNEGIEGVSFAYNTSVTVFLCLSIYCIAQKENLYFKIPEAMNALFFIYVFHNEAEWIKTESERLASSFYNISWIGKPMWLKKSLIIIMTRCNNPVEIKPFTIMELSLKNFAVVLNAAYSYYNVLNSFNNKKN